MKRPQQGLAMVLALTALALATSAVAIMQAAHALWLRQAEIVAAHVRADLAARTGIEWSLRMLADPARDHARPKTIFVVPSSVAGEAQLSLAVADAQALFNLNNLIDDGRVNEAQVAAFRRLLVELGLPGELAQRAALAVEADAHARGAAASTRWLDVARLARVPGFGAGHMARLRPFVIALPEATPLNVNGAQAELLAAFIPGLSVSDARALLAARAHAPFSDIAQFEGALPDGVRVPAEIVLDTTSQYYLVHSHARYDRAVVAYEALLGKAGERPEIIWRKRSDT